MASGHVNRTQRPNTWLHRPTLRREDSPCQLGAVHTWPISAAPTSRLRVRYWEFSCRAGSMAGAAVDNPHRRFATSFAALQGVASALIWRPRRRKIRSQRRTTSLILPAETPS